MPDLIQGLTEKGKMSTMSSRKIFPSKLFTWLQICIVKQMNEVFLVHPTTKKPRHGLFEPRSILFCKVSREMRPSQTEWSSSKMSWRRPRRRWATWSPSWRKLSLAWLPPNNSSWTWLLLRMPRIPVMQLLPKPKMRLLMSEHKGTRPCMILVRSK